MNRSRRAAPHAVAALVALGAAGALASVACTSTRDAPASPVDDAGPVRPDAAAPDGDGDVAPPGPLGLAPGEVGEVAFVDGRAAAELATQPGEAYVALLVSGRLDDARAVHGYTLEDAPGPATATRVLDACSFGPSPFAGRPPPLEPAPTGDAPAVGTQRQLEVPVGARVETIDAEVVATSERAVVWADVTAAHPATLDPAFVTAFLADYDRVLAPRARALFGAETDVDGDGRVGLVFSPLTRDSAVAFFTGCDLAALPGCHAGNRGEWLYLTPPANIAPPYDTPAAIKEILAHELAHLVHFGRKVVRNRLTSWPDSTYLVEGMGGFAQDALGWQAGNFYVTQAGLDGIDDFSLAETWGAERRATSARDGLLRGASYLAVRWLFDRAGGDVARADGTLEDRGGIAWLREALDARGAVTGVVEAHLAAPRETLVADFYTALALSGGASQGDAAPTNGCFAFAPVIADPVTGRPRGADPRASFHGQKLTGPRARPLAEADGALRAGGVEVLRFDAAEGDVTRVGFVVDDATAARAVLRIARLR